MPDVLVFNVSVEIPDATDVKKLADTVDNKLSDSLKYLDPPLEFRVTQVLPIWAPPKDMA